MKKILSLHLCVALLGIVLAGCASLKSTKIPQEMTPAPEPTAAPAPEPTSEPAPAPAAPEPPTPEPPITTALVSVNRDYDWYLNQQGSGPDEDINCGPACAVMAALWYDGNFPITVEEARNSIPEVLREWWYYKHIKSFLRSNNIDITYMYSFSADAARSYIDKNSIMIVNLHMKDITYGRGDDRIGRFYGKTYGHFIILKGYVTIDGVDYFEVYDPYTMNSYYTDGSPKGKDRLYRADEVEKTVRDWGDGEYIVINPPPAK